MWRSFKSWWYWNMPEWEDLLFYVGITFTIVTTVSMAYLSNEDRKEFVAECHAKGGEPIQGAHRKYYCIDKEAIK